MFKLSEDFEDYYESYRDFYKGNKNGIVIKKSIERYENGHDSILYIAELYHNGKEFTIGIGDTVEEIEKEVNDFLQNTNHFFQVEKVNEY